MPVGPGRQPRGIWLRSPSPAGVVGAQAAPPCAAGWSPLPPARPRRPAQGPGLPRRGQDRGGPRGRRWGSPPKQHRTRTRPPVFTAHRCRVRFTPVRVLRPREEQAKPSELDRAPSRRGRAKRPHPPCPAWSVLAPPHRGQLRSSPCLSRHFPQPRYLPHPRPACLSPPLLPASAWGCGLARPRFLCGCRGAGWTLQAGARPAGVPCRVGTGRLGAGGTRRLWEGRGFAGSPARCQCCCLQARVCPSAWLRAWRLRAWLLRSGTPRLWLLRVLSSGLTAALALRAEPSSLVTARQPRGMRVPGRGRFPSAPAFPGPGPSIRGSHSSCHPGHCLRGLLWPRRFPVSSGGSCAFTQCSVDFHKL